jgi:phosphinothricin acetyltransferase
MDTTPATTPAVRGRRKINVDAYKDDIIALLAQKLSLREISAALKQKHGVNISGITIQRRLQIWEIPWRQRAPQGVSDRPDLIARVKALLTEGKYSTKEILDILSDEGFPISDRTLRKIRIGLGIRLRVDDPEKLDAKLTTMKTKRTPPQKIIRPVKEAYLPQIRDINTHYILNTSLTFARAPPPFESYSAKMHDLASQGLPYMVTVDRTQKAADGTDFVLAYGYLSPFRGHLVSYAPTVELTLFVRPDYQSRSIGSDLLRFFLDRVKNGLVNHRCQGEGDQGIDAPARVRNVIAVMAVDPEGRDEGEALRRWYIKRGFEESGRLKKVGYKRGHW